jgi:hypothetical protein
MEFDFVVLSRFFDSATASRSEAVTPLRMTDVEERPFMAALRRLRNEVGF